MSDDFSARYRLLKCVLVEDGTRTHNAQELATGRVVMVHITDAAGPDEVDALRAQLAQLPDSDKNRVLETATLPSGFAVVTEFMAATMSFRSWLNFHAPLSAVPPLVGQSIQPAAEMITSMAFEEFMAAPATVVEATLAPLATPAPVTPPEATPEPVTSAPVTSASVTPAPATPPPAAGSFTQLFGTPADPAPIAQPAPTVIDLTLGVERVALASNSLGKWGIVPTPPTPPTPTPPPALTASAPAAPIAPAADIATATPASTPKSAAPGEFTKMFASGALGSAVAPEPPPVSVTPPKLAEVPASYANPVVSQPVNSQRVVSQPVISQPMVSPPVFSQPVIAPAPPPAKTPGEFTMMFGAPATAAPLPEQSRPSPMSVAPPPMFSELTPESRLESPPVEPLHRVMSGNSNYVAGINQAGPSPIAPNILGGQFFGPSAPLMPVAPNSAASATPLFAKEKQLAGEASSGPGILPPPIFSSGSSTPLSSLGGAAPRVNANAGPSEYTQLIANGAAPVIPPLAPSTPKGMQDRATKRRLPTGLVVAINAVLLIAALLLFFVLRRPVPTLRQALPQVPVMPNMPTAPKIPTGKP